MSQRIIAKRYAKAFFHLATEEGLVDETAKALDVLDQAYASNDALKKLFHNTRFNMNEKVSVLIELLETIGTPPLVKTFLQYLLQQRRIGAIHEIHQTFAVLRREHLRILKVHLTVAHPIEEGTIPQIRQQLESTYASSIELTIGVNPSILGGSILHVGSKVFNNSIQHQLHRVRESIIRG